MEITLLPATILLDTGCRINEILSLNASDVDLDNLLLYVNGKSDKNERSPLASSVASFFFVVGIFKYATERTVNCGSAVVMVPN